MKYLTLKHFHFCMAVMLACIFYAMYRNVDEHPRLTAFLGFTTFMVVLLMLQNHYEETPLWLRAFVVLVWIIPTLMQIGRF